MHGCATRGGAADAQNDPQVRTSAGALIKTMMHGLDSDKQADEHKDSLYPPSSRQGQRSRCPLCNCPAILYEEKIILTPCCQ